MLRRLRNYMQSYVAARIHSEILAGIAASLLRASRNDVFLHVSLRAERSNLAVLYKPI